MDHTRVISHHEFKHCLIAAGLRVAAVGGCGGPDGGWLALVYRGSHGFWVASLATAPASGGCGLATTAACPGCTRNLITGDYGQMAAAGRCLSSQELDVQGALRFIRSRPQLKKSEAELSEWVKSGGSADM